MEDILSLNNFWDTVLFLFYMILVLIVISKSIVKVPENQRVVVFRFGRFLKILEPRFHLIIPFIDFRFALDLNVVVPGWKGLSKEELNRQVKELVLEDPNLLKL